MSYLDQDIEHTFEGFKEKIENNMSEGSIRGFETMFKLFDNFCISKYGNSMHQVIADVQKSPGKRVWKVLQDWIYYQKEQGLGAVTIKVRFSHLNKYLFWMGIKLDKRDVEMNLDFPVQNIDKKYPLKLEEIQKILTVASYDKKLLYLCQISSLMRIGELCQLRKKDLDTSREFISVNIRASTAKKRKERTTFFGKEASALLRPKLKKHEDDDLLFPHDVKIKSNAGAMEQQILAEYLSKIGLDMRYETSGYLKISTHSFRAYGITKVKRIDPALAYFLAGQDDRVYLAQYDRFKDDPDELYKAYEKVEPHLRIITPKQDESKEIQELREKLNEYESRDDDRKMELWRVHEDYKQLEDLVMKAVKGELKIAPYKDSYAFEGKK